MNQLDIETTAFTLVDMLDELLGMLHETLTQPDLNDARASLAATVHALDAELNALLTQTWLLQPTNGSRPASGHEHIQ